MKKPGRPSPLPGPVRYSQKRRTHIPKGECPEELDCFGKALEPGRGMLISYAEVSRTKLFRNTYNETSNTSTTNTNATETETSNTSTTNANATETSNTSTINAKEKALFVTTGGMIPEVFEAVALLRNENIKADVYNLRFLKPLDKTYFISLMNGYEKILFVEDGIRIGGIGTYLESLLQRNYADKKTAVCGFPNRYLAQGKRHEILEDAHLSPSYLKEKMLRLFTE